MRYLLTLAAAVAWAGGACGMVDEAVPAGREEAITDGQSCTDHPEVGLFRAGASVCTATLVGRRTALTAAHCLGAASAATVTLNDTPYPVDRIVLHPDWNAATLANDLAVLLLSSEPGVAPVPIARQPPTEGLALELVGFGLSAETASDAFVKREAKNFVAALEPARFTVAGTGSGVGNICHGDSGGPALALESGRQQLVGVASAGLPPCGTLAYFTRPDAYLSWLSESSGGDLEAGGGAGAGGESGPAGRGVEALAGHTGGCAVGGRPAAPPLDIAVIAALAAFALRIGSRALRRGATLFR